MNWVLFEWKLIIRNKRLRQQFMIFMILLPLMVYMQFVSSNLLKETFFLKEFFLWAVFALPAHLATFAFSSNAMFIEKLIIARGSIFQILQAKYRLFSIIAVVLFIMFLPSISLGVKFIELIAAFLFSIGFVSFGLFWTSLASYKPFDIKAISFYNFQGFDAGNYFFPILVLIFAFGFTMLFYWLFNETITLIAMSLIGLVFIATNRIWLEKISKRFEKNKYRRLEHFREK